MQNILVRLSNTSTTASSGCVVTPRVQRTTRARPANVDEIGLASSNAPTPTRPRFRRPAAQITATAGDEKDAFFDPAEDKVYRHASFYKLPPEVDQM